MKTAKNKNEYRRLEAVALLGEGKTVKEVCEIVKYNEKYVRILGCKFRKQGLKLLAEDGRKGGNHRHMTHEEAAEFSEQFKESAENGQVITIETIAAAFDKKTGIFSLPPYTPEMNPIEQIWKEFRKRGFKNEAFKTLNKVVDRLCDVICSITPQTIASITHRDWIDGMF